ncbi:MAG: dehydrogenase [Microbacterium sp. SCN 70-200]|uniref:phytoene desaturase family protein n=1 Tax=unclassified Microbacterium TaxID=2609290 RepID=UPI00086BDD0A|nr:MULTISPECIES: NAD(P)/FAD-dependent oxidoreductase [unclassified Microbacterium]MBN9215637.1 NAD(P)/FAD-dependent oxidoreductase [Microbacterium sp.]ODT41255.1 MAG: dehydrogenase [Microbacterium sp. SCN 70-200]OJV79349.1 MAG: dehydrogenase [Microbacterium sp. 70-16]
MSPRATIVGSGPNGLVAAVTLARAGYSVRVLEAAGAAGGSARTAELTLPGFRHDVGSAVHPVARSSVWFRAFGLDRRVEWLVPDASFAHPLPSGPTAIAWRDLDRTAASLGADGTRWRRLIQPLRDHLDGVVALTGDHLLRVPRHPVTAAAFAVRTALLGTAPSLALRTEAGLVLWAGVAAHAARTLPSLAGSAAGLLLAAHAHAATGWPVPRGGAGAITDALIDDLLAHGGELSCNENVVDVAALDWGDAAAGDVLVLAGSPRLAATVPGIPGSYAAALGRYRYGPGLAKIDLALDGPVPWRDPDLGRAVTVHVGGTAEQVRASAAGVARGRLSPAPYVLVAQPSVIDASRAPAGAAVLWAYLHVPRGAAALDPSEPILRRLEEFAPGIRDRIIGRHVTRASQLAARNPAAIGGDGLGGLLTLRQAVRSPVVSTVPWRTPARGVYLAGSALPPGPGVTGMPGWYAARTVLTDARGSVPRLEDLFGASAMGE